MVQSNDSNQQPIIIYKASYWPNGFVECWTDETGSGGYIIPKWLLDDLERSGLLEYR